ncbi:MAG: hypothetical protein KBE09_04520 [Candidatus Pacebacteria bacterium]|nr:hypothetical protein [Candidatus Paceibacterota bacterium]
MASRPLKQDVPRIHPGPLLVFTALIALGILAVSGRIPGLSSLLASTTSSLYTAPATLFMIPQGETALRINDTSIIDVNINANTAVNVVGTTITFPPELLDIVAVSKEKSLLDLWTEDTTIKEEAGEIRFSGGTTRPGGHLATGTLLTLTVRAKSAGEAQLSFTNTQVFSHDGKGKALEHEVRSLSYHITEVEIPQANNEPTGIAPAAALAPNADLNGDDRISLIDVSIFTFKMLGAYSPRYDLNTDGSLGLSDLSILFTKMR